MWMGIHFFSPRVYRVWLFRKLLIVLYNKRTERNSKSFPVNFMHSLRIKKLFTQIYKLSHFTYPYAILDVCDFL